MTALRSFLRRRISSLRSRIGASGMEGVSRKGICKARLIAGKGVIDISLGQLAKVKAVSELSWMNKSLELTNFSGRWRLQKPLLGAMDEEPSLGSYWMLGEAQMEGNFFDGGEIDVFGEILLSGEIERVGIRLVIAVAAEGPGRTGGMMKGCLVHSVVDEGEESFFEEPGEWSEKGIEVGVAFGDESVGKIPIIG